MQRTLCAQPARDDVPPFFTTGENVLEDAKDDGRSQLLARGDWPEAWASPTGRRASAPPQGRTVLEWLETGLTGGDAELGEQGRSPKAGPQASGPGTLRVKCSSVRVKLLPLLATFPPEVGVIFHAPARDSPAPTRDPRRNAHPKRPHALAARLTSRALARRSGQWASARFRHGHAHPRLLDPRHHPGRRHWDQH